jgi:hypothetical protein
MSTTDKLAEALRKLHLAVLGWPKPGEPSVSEAQDLARAALAAYEAEAKPAEPVAYWFRHINTEGEPTDDWKPVKANDFYMQTVEDSVRELLVYRYEGKPCYEVMPLYAAPAAPAPHPDTKDAERYRWLKHECDTRGSRGSRIVQSQWGLEWDGAVDAAIAASKGGADAN